MKIRSLLSPESMKNPGFLQPRFDFDSSFRVDDHIFCFALVEGKIREKKQRSESRSHPASPHICTHVHVVRIYEYIITEI